MNKLSYEPKNQPRPVIPVNVLRIGDQLTYRSGNGRTLLSVISIHMVSRILGSTCPMVTVDHEDTEGNLTTGRAGLLVGTYSDAHSGFIEQAVPAPGSELGRVVVEVATNKGATELIELGAHTA